MSCIATSYASIDSKLYRYHFGRGGSGHVVDSLTRAQFYTSAITAIDSISPAVQKIAAGHAHPAAVSAAYESARASIIGYVASQLIEHSTSAVLGAALEHLRSVANESDIIRAITRFYPQLLSSLRLHSPRLQDGSRSVRTIALVTGTLRTGGVSAVIAAQTRFLSEAGYRVVVIARTPGGDASPLPPGTTFLELRDRELSGKLQEWQRICGSNDIDLVIDHQILYTSDWPQFALVARGEGAATIGWLHNSVARPILVGNDRLSLIERCSSLLSKLVTLSRLDAAYFSLRGIDHAVWLPNPPSPLMLSAPAPRTPKPFSPDRIELVWWGRLEQRTKQVYDLISVGAALDRLSVEYHLTVIGPDWDDVTAAKFNARARQYGVAERVVAIGPRRGQALIDAIDAAHLFVSTSVIEGYQLTIAEAQSRGLPVVMYELPWLDLVQDNEGIIAVPQGDADAIAAEIATLASNPSRYTELSNASLAASERVLRRDLPGLYRDLVEDTLPVSFTPKATINDAGALLGLIVSFAERAQTGSRSRRPPSARVGRVWRSLAPLGRAVAKRLPGLRPLIHRAKKALGLT
ncbi:glycosyltransferase family 4 protein [Microbacterium sp.]|uniref:glycosyltransferase family 4 protein n=1 Tax=Microbacterium sp. TaxID=51671 RepID=UPI003735937C